MYKLIGKRSIDLLASLCLILILSPVLLVVTICLYVANDGYPFFFQSRPGKGERIFTIIKFKTMNDKKDANGKYLSDAERLTKVGRFIRKTSLDELPQLFNVIKGDMSFIGPRPLFDRYLSYYTPREKLRHHIRPGITGLAQVSGRNNLCWDDRLELDAYYVENLSATLDVKIIYKTILHVVSGKDVLVIPGSKYSPLDIERNKN